MHGSEVLKAPCDTLPQKQPGFPASEVCTDAGQRVGAGSAQRPLRQRARAGAALQLPPTACAGRGAPGPPVPGAHAESLPRSLHPLPWALRAEIHWLQMLEPFPVLEEAEGSD